MNLPLGDQAGSSLKMALEPLIVMRLSLAGSGGGGVGSVGGAGTLVTKRSTIDPSSIE